MSQPLTGLCCSRSSVSSWSSIVLEVWRGLSYARLSREVIGGLTTRCSVTCWAVSRMLPPRALTMHCYRWRPMPTVRLTTPSLMRGPQAGKRPSVPRFARPMTKSSASGARAATQVALLLTDGLQTTGEAVASVIPDLVDAGVRVYAIGVGPTIDEPLLSEVATRTGGRLIRIDPTLAESDQSGLRSVQPSKTCPSRPGTTEASSPVARSARSQATLSNGR